MTTATPKQTALPGLLPAGEPVECPANELAAMLAKIKAAGLRCFRMTVKRNPERYQLLLTPA